MAIQNESRLRLQSASDSKQQQDKLHETLQTFRDMVAELKSDKLRLQETIYRLKSEAMSSSIATKELKEQLEEERRNLVRQVH